MSIVVSSIKAAHRALVRQTKAEERAVQVGTVRALNKSAKTGQVAASRKIRETVNLKAGAVNKVLRIRRASRRQLEAAVQSKYERVPLIAYNNVRQTKAGVTVKMRKDKPRKLFASAFIRNKSKGSKDKNVYRRHPQAWLWGKNRPETSSPNLPLKVLYGPTVFKVFGEVIDVMTDEAERVLEKNLQHEIDFALKQAEGKK